LQHISQAERLARRSDRYSQLLAKAIKDEQSGQHLVTRSGLTAEEHEELAALREEAHASFREELLVATSELRGLLGSGDPFYTIAWVQATDLLATWGGYYEPTARGGENRVELVASLLASQPPSERNEHLSSAQMQQVYDQLDHIVELLYLFNLSMGRGEGADAAALRFMGAMRWMSVRGSSFADHGKDLARAVFSPYDDWLLQTYGFTVGDLISVGEAAEALTRRLINALLEHARRFASDVRAHLDDSAARKQLPAAVRANTTTAEEREAAARFAFIDVVSSGIRDGVMRDVAMYGTLHHVTVRPIERWAVLRDDVVQADSFVCLAARPG
jgi:hypothetical protein